MFKQLTLIALALSSLSAVAEDTIYIRDFDHAISKARIMGNDGYLAGHYEALFIGETLVGSTDPMQQVDIRLRTKIEYYGENLSHATEITRAVAAESCLNMANQLRLSSNKTLALKLTIPSVSTLDQMTGTREYLIDHVDNDQYHNHMGFECELTLPPGPVTQFDGDKDWAPTEPGRPTRR